MMTAVTLFTILLLLVFFSWQAVLTLRFVSKLRCSQMARLEDEDCPKTVVILCVRGGDPFLEKCLDGLVKQSYPSYDIRVVVDHELDPALPLVRAVQERSSTKNLKFGILKNRRDTCTLKCSSLLEAVEDLDDSYEAIALIDADTVPHSDWLRELVTPLREAKIGAATGNRWFAPSNPTLGAVVRYFWNVFAIVQMFEFRIPWGGSLALKMEVVRESDLLERWSRAFCEDTMTLAALRELNLGLAFVPSLLMVNRENCSVPDFFRWVIRQLLTVRFYHPCWSLVLTHGIITSLIPVLVGAFLVAANWFGDWQSYWMVSAVFGYLVLMVSLWVLIEASIKRNLAARGQNASWMKPSAVLRLMVAIPILQVLYPVILGKTLLAKNVSWREMDYNLSGPWKVSFSKYEPYQAGERKTGESL